MPAPVLARVPEWLESGWLESEWLEPEWLESRGHPGWQEPALREFPARWLQPAVPLRVARRWVFRRRVVV